MRKLLRYLILWAVPEAANPRYSVGNGRYVSFDSEAMRDPNLHETIRELIRISEQQRPR